MVAQIASVSAMMGLPFVLPELRAAYHLTTAQAGALAGLPSLGLLLTLLGWGVVIDRYGERFTMTVSLALTAGFLLLLGVVDGPLGVGAVLLLVGAAGGPVNAASGRLVLGWFSRRERGLAMGIRQGAQPLGMGLAAAALPLVAAHHGFVTAMLLPAALALAVLPFVAMFAAAPPAVAAAGDDPARPAKPGSPYRQARIWRVHAASVLLIVPQFTLATYALVYLVDEHGWSAPLAGAVVAAGQVPGALARLGAGLWSDRTGSRLRPVRILAAACAAALLVLAGASSVLPGLAVVLLLICLVLSVSHNGLTFTAVAETAGLAWAGRAMAAQNSLQALGSTLTPVLMGVAIDGAGFPAAFALAAVFAAAAITAVPRSEQPSGPSAT
ncbi:MFS transporter [Marinitenerispora sediminis]|uniref:MFS transporter n=1 Tax=Marinitenerispora sediminis TaxID=1931232 RepID=A0A368T242_9ACTN|nr:MFS transporter [Marinitenerispora sediminis]RCV51441.1 MFS transporter [Marinitenerispora sediminis]RCV54958.1 MFS transporter [Marinitenerispora sediminis]